MLSPDIQLSILTVCELLETVGPTIGEITHLDLTAYQPAEQILIENEKDRSEEAQELCRKASQLLSILNFYARARQCEQRDIKQK